MEVQTIAVWDVAEKLKEKKAILIDLREKEEYDSEHMEGAIWIPYDTVVDEISRFDKKQVLILYCDRGNASLMAGRVLAGKGYTVYTILGGFLAYKRMKR